MLAVVGIASLAVAALANGALFWFFVGAVGVAGTVMFFNRRFGPT